MLGLPPSTGVVSVYVHGRDDDRYAWAEDVKVDGRPVALGLRQGMTLAGRIDETLDARSGGGGLLHARSLDTGIERYAENRRGSFRVRGLPPGRHEISLANAKGRWIASVQADAGDEGVVLR